MLPTIALGGTGAPTPEALPDGMPYTAGKWYFCSAEGEFLQLYPALEPVKYFALREQWQTLPLSSSA
jgi:hypothetical protein